MYLFLGVLLLCIIMFYIRWVSELMKEQQVLETLYDDLNKQKDSITDRLYKAEKKLNQIKEILK
jgi:hypothetical protein